MVKAKKGSEKNSQKFISLVMVFNSEVTTVAENGAKLRL